MARQRLDLPCTTLSSALGGFNLQVSGNKVMYASTDVLGSSCKEQRLTVRRLELRAHVDLGLYDGEWQLLRNERGETFHSVRASRGALEKATRHESKVVANAIIAAVNEYARAHPEILARAECVRLNNEAARLEEKAEEHERKASGLRQQIAELDAQAATLATSSALR